MKQIIRIVTALLLLTSATAIADQPIRMLKAEYYAKPENSWMGSYHTILDLGVNGDTVTFENESVWIFDSSSWDMVKEWRTDDILLLRPNNPWFSWSKPKFKYCIENDRTGEFALVNCSLSHYSDNLNLIYIVRRSPSYLRMNDGSVWKVKYSDREKMNSWGKDAVVMIGINNTWFWDNTPNVLINMDTFDFVRAELTQPF